MRKILLASTALVALTSVSAMAADVTISGGYNFIYQNDDKDSNTDAGSFASEGDVNIKFSNTTDSGITTTLNYGMHETGLKASGATDNLAGSAATAVNSDGAAYDDLNASLSGDFGTLYFDPAGDDVALGGFDEKADKAGEGTDSGMASGYRGGILGASGTTVGYKLPSLVDGLTIALSHGEGAGEYFGYGIGYDADMFSIGYVAEATNTVKNKTVSVGVEVAGISFGADQVTYKDDDDATAERKTEAYGVSYSIDSLTLAYEMGKMDNENNNTEVENHKQVQVSYAVAPGITAIVSSSEVDSTANDANDKEVMELQLKLSF
jgi:hypothetical protein